jgi:O-methyltransferase involved in polyketide biosynthesis
MSGLLGAIDVYDVDYAVNIALRRRLVKTRGDSPRRSRDEIEW